MTKRAIATWRKASGCSPIRTRWLRCCGMRGLRALKCALCRGGLRRSIRGGGCEERWPSPPLPLWAWAAKRTKAGRAVGSGRGPSPQPPPQGEGGYGVLAGRRVLLIVSGGIAAYKALELIRLLRGRGCGVTCVLTEAGAHFVTPLSLQALSETKVYTDLFSLTDESEMGHIQLSRSADLVVVAPASADILGKMAAGLAGDLASTLLLAYPQELAGLCLFAPYLGSHLMTGEIARARGPHAWEPGDAADDDERAHLALHQDARSRRPIHLGLGARIASLSARLLAAALGGGRGLALRRDMTGRPGGDCGTIFWTVASCRSSPMPDPAPRPGVSADRPPSAPRWCCTSLAAAAVIVRATGCGRGRSAPSSPTICCSPRRACGRAARSWDRTGRACPAGAARAAVAITIDDGPDPEVTPRVLDLLEAARRARDVLLHRRARRAAPGSSRARSCARGHAVENHS